MCRDSVNFNVRICVGSFFRNVKVGIGGSVCAAIRKAGAKSKLRSFLDVNEPELVEMLHRLWNHQGKAITYKELREAILSGEFARDGKINGGYAEKWLNDWRQDYSRFVENYMLPEWKKSFAAGLQEIADKHPGWYFNPSEIGVRDWARRRGAQFVTNSTQTQLDGLKAVIRRASTGDMHGMSVDKLAHVIRPMVGLTWRQGIANVNYYESLIKGGMSEKKALEKAILYGQKQHRYRGYNIARTELAFAYNHGSISGVREAQRVGLMGAVVKRWVTASDERTCAICNMLNGTAIELDGEFSCQGKGGERIPINPRLTEPETKQVPPAHPSCRCAVAFDEVSPPTMETMANAASYDKLVDAAPKQNRSGFDVIEEIGWLQSAGRYDIIEEVPENLGGGQSRMYAMGNYLNADGDFDLDRAVNDFRKYLDSLEDAKAGNIAFYLDRAVFEKKYSPGLVLGYNPLDEKIYYNPNHPWFGHYDFHTSVTHELSHMIDSILIHSANDEQFTNAINKAKKTVLDKLDYFYEQAEKESNGFLSDIMSGITEDKYDFSGHNKEYWQYPGSKEREVFANLYAMETLKSKDKECETALKVFKDNFPEIWDIYCGLLSREGL